MTLNRVLAGWSQRQVELALRVERANKRRRDVLRRLHQRLGVLRARAERDDIMRGG